MQSLGKLLVIHSQNVTISPFIIKWSSINRAKKMFALKDGWTDRQTIVPTSSLSQVPRAFQVISQKLVGKACSERLSVEQSK